jgi:tetratricopeptide (TPR) repeat protein
MFDLLLGSDCLMRCYVLPPGTKARIVWWGLGLLLCAVGPRLAIAQQSLEARGDSLFSAQDNLRALSVYKDALKTEESFNLLFKAGSAALLVGQYTEGESEAYFEEAVDFAERLGKGYPDQPGSWTLLAATTGQLAKFRGPREKARVARGVYTHVHQALALDSTYAFAYVVAGILAREVSQLGWVKRLAASAVLGGLPPGSLPESKRHLARAIQAAPEFIIARWEFAKTCLALGQDDEALVHLNYIKSLTPANSEEDRLQRKAAGVGADLSRRLLGKL